VEINGNGTGWRIGTVCHLRWHQDGQEKIFSTSAKAVQELGDVARPAINPLEDTII